MQLTLSIPQRLIIQALLNSHRDPDASKLDVAEDLLNGIKVGEDEKKAVNFHTVGTSEMFNLDTEIPTKEFRVTAEQAGLIKELVQKYPKTIVDKNSWYRPLIEQL